MRQHLLDTLMSDDGLLRATKLPIPSQVPSRAYSNNPNARLDPAMMCFFGVHYDKFGTRLHRIPASNVDEH